MRPLLRQFYVQLFRDEADYLKRKNDEKDRRLEVLICERNTLRFESAEQQKAGEAAAAAKEPNRKGRSRSVDSLPDLEDGLGNLRGTAEGSGTAMDAVRVFVADSDVLLRRFSRVLFVSPMTRRIFYGYILVLHVWIWVVLHRAASLHTAGPGDAHDMKKLR